MGKVSIVVEVSKAAFWALGFRRRSLGTLCKGGGASKEVDWALKWLTSYETLEALRSILEGDVFRVSLSAWVLVW